MSGARPGHAPSLLGTPWKRDDHTLVARVAAQLAAGADPMETDGGISPLLWAADIGRADVVRLLIRHGADPRVPVGGDLPLHAACAGTHDIDTVRALLDAGSDPAVPEDSGFSPLAWLCRTAIGKRPAHFSITTACAGALFEAGAGVDPHGSTSPISRIPINGASELARWARTPAPIAARLRFVAWAWNDAIHMAPDFIDPAFTAWALAQATRHADQPWAMRVFAACGARS